jgi:enoyl-CoA hydratase
MSLVSIELKDGIAHLGMDDGKANALSYAMMDALDHAFDQAATHAKAVVLSGRAGRFSAGFDLKEMMAGPDRARALVSRGADLLLRAYMLPMPLVTVATGHALAGGALLLATGDVRFAARGPFQIGLNEVQIGLPVPVLAMELARDRLAPSHFIPATLFATIYDPDQAKVAGWVDEVVDAEALLARADEQAKKLATLGMAPYAKSKEIMRERTVSYIRETLPQDLERLVPSPA